MTGLRMVVAHDAGVDSSSAPSRLSAPSAAAGGAA